MFPTVPPSPPSFPNPTQAFFLLSDPCVCKTNKSYRASSDRNASPFSFSNQQWQPPLFVQSSFFLQRFVQSSCTCNVLQVRSSFIDTTKSTGTRRCSCVVSLSSPDIPPLPLLIFSFPPPALSRQTVSPLHSILFSPSPALSFPLSCLLLPFLPVAFHLSPSLPSTLPLHPFTPTQARAARQRTSPTLSTLLLLHSSLAAPRSHPLSMPSA